MARLQQTPDWRRMMAQRLAVVAAVFAACLIALFARLVNLQVFQHDALTERSRDQREDEIRVAAQRGEILDRNGRVLAISVDLDDVWVKRAKIADPDRAAAALCAALSDCSPAELAERAKDFARRRGQVRIRRQVTPEQARRVEDLRMDAVTLVKAPHRYYLNRELAAHVLGFVGVDHDGQGGVEAAFDPILKGREGQLLLQMKGGRTPTPFSRGGTPPVPGKSLELTIDANIQYIAEQALRDCVHVHQALGGSIVVMVPGTGEILALANEPTFNPNSIKLSPDTSRKNRAIQDIYEPGSTFKIVTASAALEEKVFHPDDLIATGDGRIRFGSRLIDEYKGHAYGTLSFTDVIVKSSNIGAVKIGLQVGSERLARYVERYGFGTKLLNRELPGESRGQVWPVESLKESEIASVSMGYQVGVTPLQVAVAASTVANGGELAEPHVVRAIIDGGTRQVIPRAPRRRVTSPETAEELTTIMEAVVQRGTGRSAALKDYTVAGKTGTATKVINGRYVESDNVVSFVGFAPSRKPALAILVVIDTPRVPSRSSGGVVAAPVFQRVADAALRYLGVPPTISPAQPVLVAATASPTVDVPEPPAPVTIVPALASVPDGQVVLPDLRGLSGREALRVLARIGIATRLTGDGMVVEQDPPAGTPVNFGAACRLGLARAIPGILP